MLGANKTCCYVHEGPNFSASKSRQRAVARDSDPSLTSSRCSKSSPGRNSHMFRCLCDGGLNSIWNRKIQQTVGEKTDHVVDALKSLEGQHKNQSQKHWDGCTSKEQEQNFRE